MNNGWNKFKALFWQPAEDDDEADAELADALETLKELEGVVGSIAIDSAGSVRACDLPRVFDESMIGLIGARMVELRSALTDDAREPVSGSLDFEGHSFHVKSFPLGMVGVLLNEGAHRPTVGMALNLVSRRVAATFETLDGGVEP